jgi:hypothetical protein
VQCRFRLGPCEVRFHSAPLLNPSVDAACAIAEDSRSTESRRAAKRGHRRVDRHPLLTRNTGLLASLSEAMPHAYKALKGSEIFEVLEGGPIKELIWEDL